MIMYPFMIYNKYLRLMMTFEKPNPAALHDTHLVVLTIYIIIIITK